MIVRYLPPSSGRERVKILDLEPYLSADAESLGTPPRSTLVDDEGLLNRRRPGTYHFPNRFEADFYQAYLAKLRMRMRGIDDDDG